MLAVLAAVCGPVTSARALRAKPVDSLGELRLAPSPQLASVRRTSDDPLAVLLRDVLADTNKYALNTWWQERMSGLEPVGSWAGRYRDQGTLDSEQVRRYSAVAMQLAATLSTGDYSATVTGVPRASAVDRTVELVQVLTRTHLANLPDGGWGGSWQSALWASQAGLAAWLLVAELTQFDQLLLGRMLAYEADAVHTRDLKWYRDRDGRYLSHGDSGAEELAWDGLALFTFVELLPHHSRRAQWAESAYARFVGAYSRPSDVHSTAGVNGKPVSEWLDGSNTEQDGWVVNHGRLNPDYTENISLPAASVAALAGDGVPHAVLFNAAFGYRALTEQRFEPPRYKRPGGTFYVPNSAALYWPTGPDWGDSRQAVYGGLDVMVSALGLDRGNRVPARRWAELHLRHVRKMQSRFDTGQIYGPASEDRYFGREEHAGAVLARAHLTLWLAERGRIHVDVEPPWVAKQPQ